MDYSQLDDSVLMQRIANADTKAFSELYDRYSRLVFSQALNAIGNQAKAEEITQEVFLRVWENAETYRAGRAKVSTWLTSISRYRSIDELRRMDSRPEGHTADWAEAETSLETTSNLDDPEGAVRLSLQQQRVRAAIADLPPEQRKALAMAFFEGYTHREIADTLNHPLGTVKTRIRLAMQKLQRKLQGEPV